MGNLAFMLKQAGHKVSGSDLKLYPPMSDKLTEWGLETNDGFNAKNIKDPDLVIIGNAISRGNPEVEEVLNRGIEYISMPQAISHFFLKNKKVIVVAGTHGKTTTTFLIHFILKELGLKPGLFVGGIRKDGAAGFEIGEGEYFVIEGDEYDSAFFDKGSKFLHYRPYYLALTALDFDHADIFPDIEAIKVMFRRLLNLVPSKGKVFYWQGSKNLTELCTNFKHAPVASYEIDTQNSILRLKNNTLYYKKNDSTIKAKLIGIHNFRNIEVAANICKETGASVDKILSAIMKFPGVKRRQEILYESRMSTIMEDFAHHPVAIEETVKAVKDAYPEHKIISMFEPRSATSHRNVFQREFSESFKGSNVAMITEVYNLEKVDKKNRLNVKQLVLDTKKKSKVKETVYCKNPDDLLKQLAKTIKNYPKDKIIILAMSNGAFGGIYPKLIELVKKRDEAYK